MYRVAHVITDLNSGGAEMMLCKLATAMEGEKSTSAVISLMDDGSLGERLKSDGIPVYSLHFRRGRPSLFGLIRLLKVIRSIRPDLIQGWMYHGNIAACVAGLACRPRVPVAWNIRQSLYDFNDEKCFTRLMIRMGAALSGRVDSIIYNSRTSETQHGRCGYDSVSSRVIPNGFDMNKFKPDDEKRQVMRKRLGVADDVVLVGLVARYHPMKDHENFVSAAAKVAGRVDHVRFVLAGRGSDNANEALALMIAESGLSGKVSVLGECGDIPQLMSSLDILVISSAYGEGFPNVAGEAMACGTPCVVTDTGDSAYVIGDTGKVVPPRDSMALAEALVDVISMSKETRYALGQDARNRVISHFSLEDIAVRYDALYREMLALAEDKHSV